jgi:hypothetical protein
MLWGERQIDQWIATINKTIGTRKVTHALACNEWVIASMTTSPAFLLTINHLGQNKADSQI